MDFRSFFQTSKIGQAENDRLSSENAALRQQVENLSTVSLSLKKTEEALAESERRIRMITDTMIDVIGIMDLASVFQYVSPSLTRAYGYAAEDMIGKSALLFIHPGDVLRIAEIVREGLTKGTSAMAEMRFRHADGRYIWIECVGDVVRNEKGHITGFIVSSREITDRKEKDDLIKKSLQEKEMLLKEIHHRVKNNLQIITSLLSLQSAYIKDREDRQIFTDCQNRVRSMALIHEKLYSSESLASVNFSEYISSLVDTLYRTYGARNGQVGVEVDASRIHLDIDSALHCGLLINEIVSNSLKYAFPDGRKGKAWVKMSQAEGWISLDIGDNGVGMPGSLDIENTGTLGLQLIRSLVDQLGGTMEMDRSHGTVYNIRFKAPNS